MGRSPAKAARPATTPGRIKRIAIDPIDADASRLWQTIEGLARELADVPSWCLVGGMMVQLFAYEYHQTARPTDDIDILADARNKPSITDVIASKLMDLGALLPIPSGGKRDLGYGFTLNGDLIEILAPDGLANPPRTLGRLETIAIPGGTQALDRTEEVEIAVAGASPVRIRRPALLAALLLKARAVPVHKRPKDQLEDVVQLLGFIEDPRATKEELRGRQRRWLSALASRLDFGSQFLLDRFGATHVRRARAAFELLTS